MAEPKPTIAVVGPMPPYRGGISYYTEHLCRALQTYADVTVISFRRMYPRWLYPGDEPVALREGDVRLPQVDYLLDTYNPLSLERTIRAITRAKCETVIISWWTLYWQPAFAYLAWRLRQKGVRVIFLCHNLFDHGAKGIMRATSEYLLCQADGYIVQATDKAQLLQDMKPGALVLTSNHPIYDQFTPPKANLPKRGRLELLFFGYIRPYKGLEVLLDALERLGDPDVYVTIAGEVWGDTSALQDRLAALAQKMHLEFQLSYVDDAVAASYLKRADVVVLPYRSATGSGVVSLAYSYDTPVLATSVGGLKDVVIEGQTGWLVAPESPDELAQAITRITRPMAAKMKPAIEAFCHHNSWDAFAKKIVSFSNQVIKERS